MVLAKITTHIDSFTIELNDLSVDRKQAKIKYSSIRSLAMPNNDTEVQIIFTNGELQTFPYTAIAQFDADVNITSQQILYDKLNAVIFGV